MPQAEASAMREGAEGRVPEMPKHRLTRKRYLELGQIAKGLLDYLDGKGVEESEFCVVKRLADEMSYMKKGE